MVLKPLNVLCSLVLLFESSVNSDGTQTYLNKKTAYPMFESSVNSDGTQTYLDEKATYPVFESSVNSDGTQTVKFIHTKKNCLRVV